MVITVTFCWPVGFFCVDCACSPLVCMGFLLNKWLQIACSCEYDCKCRSVSLVTHKWPVQGVSHLLQVSAGIGLSHMQLVYTIHKSLFFFFLNAFKYLKSNLWFNRLLVSCASMAQRYWNTAPNICPLWVWLLYIHFSFIITYAKYPSLENLSDSSYIGSFKVNDVIQWGIFSTVLH